MCARVLGLHLKLATNLLFQYKYYDDIVCSLTLRSIEEFVWQPSADVVISQHLYIDYYDLSATVCIFDAGGECNDSILTFNEEIRKRRMNVLTFQINVIGFFRRRRW